MSTNNSIPIDWDNEDSGGLLGSLFPSGFGSGVLQPMENGDEDPGYTSAFVTAQKPEKDSYVKDDKPLSLLENTANDPSLVYNVVFCPTGSEVLGTYERTTPKTNELIMFCEQVPPDKSNLFGTFVLVKFGDKYRNYLENLRQKKQAVNSRRKNSSLAYRIDTFDKEVADNYSILTKDFGATLDIEKVRFAIESELNITSSSGVMLKNIFGGIEGGINYVFDGLSDLIEEVKFTEEDYVPQKKDQGYSLTDYLEKMLELEAEAIKTVVDYAIPDSVEKFISDSFESALAGIKGFIKKNLPESWLRILKKIYAVVQQALEMFKNGCKKIAELVGEAALLLKSLLMGFVNGLLSTIQTLLKVIGWLLVNLSGINGYKKLTGEYYREFQNKLEFIEDLFDLIGEKANDFFGAVLTLVFDFSLDNMKSVLKVFVGKYDSLTPYHFAYFAGSFIFEVVLAVVLAIFTGGATAVAQAASFAEKVTAMLRLVAKEAISTATMGILDILKLFKVLITKFVQACKNGWKGFKQFLENLLANKADDVIKDEGKVLDEVSEINKLDDLIKSIPGIKLFNKWFDEIDLADFEILWKNTKARNKIAGLIRHPGGLHEWLMCSRANTFKRWGVSMDEIKSLRTRIDEVVFKKPPGYHGGPGSTKAHNEILSLIDSSENYDEFKGKLINWADKRLKGGKKSLPKGFFE